MAAVHLAAERTGKPYAEMSDGPVLAAGIRLENDGGVGRLGRALRNRIFSVRAASIFCGQCHIPSLHHGYGQAV